LHCSAILCRLGLGASPLPTSDRSLTMIKIKKDLYRRLKHTSHTAEQAVTVDELDCDTGGSRSLAVHGRLNVRTTDSEKLGIKKKRKRKKHKQNVHEDPTPSTTEDNLQSSTTTSDSIPLDNALYLSEKRAFVKIKVRKLLH